MEYHPNQKLGKKIELNEQWQSADASLKTTDVRKCLTKTAKAFGKPRHTETNQSKTAWQRYRKAKQ